MEFLNSLREKFATIKNVLTSVGEWIFCDEMLNEDMRVLRRKVEELSSREVDINTELESLEHQRSGRKRRREVENWSRNVQRKKSETARRGQEVKESNYLSRLKLRRLVQNDIHEVAELVKQGRFSGGLFVDVGQHSKGEELLSVPLVGQATARRNLDNIWGCLMNEEALCVGVCGMGGIGKTTIVTHIHNRLLKDGSSFDYVYWVTVSQHSSIYKLQNDIAKVVGLDLSGEQDVTRRASMLYHRLMRSKKFVLILDDIWELFPVEKVGVPLRVNGGKLLLTTRMFQVCRGMKCQKIVKVEPLSMKESWTLFVHELGYDSVLAPPLEGIAKSMAEECAGLPLGIVAVARSMRGVKEISDWRRALYELKQPGMGLNGMENEVFRLLKFSYDRLDDERLQQCFLYCSLFHEDYTIRRNDLILYWIGEGLIDEMDSREAEFDSGNAIINRLINSCLLEVAEGAPRVACVKMHDVIRDMALMIARGNPMFMVKAGVQLRDFPSDTEWPMNLDRVSLISNRLEGCSPDLSPNCPGLKTLLMQGNKSLKKVPNCFFTNMKSLCVLNLSGSSIEWLPVSITNLVNLRVLLLRCCRQLKHVPSLSMLENLRELDLHYSGIKELPKGIERLVNLRVLDLSETFIQELIPTAVLQKLSRMQCLKLEYCDVEVKLEALVSLRKLEILRVHFSEIRKLTSYIRTEHWKRLRQYFISIGYDSSITPSDTCKLPFDKLVIVAGCQSIGPQRDRCILPNDSQYMRIRDCHNLTSLSDLLPAREHADQNFEKPETGTGEEMESIRPRGPLETGIFANLQALAIYECSKLKHLFMYGSAEHAFRNIVEITVFGCLNLEEIIAVEENPLNEISHGTTIPSILLPKLQYLGLAGLPKLRSIYGGTMVCESLEEMKVWDCGMLKKLPLCVHQEGVGQSAFVKPASLKKIMGKKDWWDSLEWDHPNSKSMLQPLFVDR